MSALQQSRTATVTWCAEYVCVCGFTSQKATAFFKHLKENPANGEACQHRLITSAFPGTNRNTPAPASNSNVLAQVCVDQGANVLARHPHTLNKKILLLELLITSICPNTHSFVESEGAPRVQLSDFIPPVHKLEALLHTMYTCSCCHLSSNRVQISPPMHPSVLWHASHHHHPS
jgi:hypothetical protein